MSRIKNFIHSGFVVAAVFFATVMAMEAQVSNPGVQQSGAVTYGNCVEWGPALGQIRDSGSSCSSGATVTSVDIASPNGTINATGGPITTSGTLDVDLPTVVTGGSVGSATASPVITYDNYGRITSASDTPITVGCGQLPALTGDVTTPGASCATTLASVISAGGPIGSSTVTPIITYDAKGRLTAVSSATVTPAFSSLTGSLALTQIAAQGANTVIANFTGSSAVPTATTVAACSNDGFHALTYTNGSGFVCTTLATSTPNNAQTGTTYTLTASDCGKFLTFSNSSPITVTLDTQTNQGYEATCQIDMAQIGSGKATISNGSVTLNSVGGNKAFSAQYAGASLKKLGTDNWLLVGSIGP